jgi:uncharacterized protein YjbI with pentapeptide repeats
VADEKALEILKQGPKAWNEWRKTNVVEADLREANLSRANLSKAKLFGAILNESIFGDSDLRDVKGVSVSL